MFADEPSCRIEPLDADVIHVDTTVHAGLNIGLGHDEQARLLQKRQNFRRIFQELVAAPEHAHVPAAHDAERTVEVRLELFSVEAIVAKTQKGEIVRSEEHTS